MHKKGIMHAISAYIIWGLFPLYWRQLEGISALQLIGHRIVWSFAFLLLLILATRNVGTLWLTINRSILQTYAWAALLISLNWFTYVWAVTNGHTVEASLGYYMNPLLSVLLGVLVIRERLRVFQWVPIGLAAFAVIYLTFALGSLPWIALILASTFGIYGLVKKTAPLNPLFGLTLETGVLFIPAVIYLTACDRMGVGAFLHESHLRNWMMVGAGLITAIPLLLFAGAATSIPLSTIGILQYVTPTLQFLIGVCIFRESFTHSHLLGFSIIWLALIVFWIEGIYSRKFCTGTTLPELDEG
jgi:chloramphenicol-sensitive protein RarD